MVNLDYEIYNPKMTSYILLTYYLQTKYVIKTIYVSSTHVENVDI